MMESPRRFLWRLVSLTRSSTEDVHRQPRSVVWIDDMRRDLYYGARILGGATAVFGLINARLFSGPAHARAHNL